MIDTKAVRKRGIVTVLELELCDELDEERAKVARLETVIREHIAAWDREDARRIEWDNCHNYPDVEDLRDALEGAG